MLEILIVDDEVGFARLLADNLEAEGYTCCTADSVPSGIKLLEERNCGVVLTDIAMPGMGGLDLLRAVKNSHPTTEVIMMTAYASVGTAVEAMKAGAYEYLTKPFDNSELLVLIERIREKSELEDENRRLREHLGERLKFEHIIGTSPKMQAVFALVEKVAPTKASVLLRGESGTGKELLAQAIHYRSPRRDDPLVKINCAAIPENLLETELFGHEKGSFTGAYQQKKGKFEIAGNGTVFLDEIGDLTPALQVKMLRVLQEGEFERVGGTKTFKTGARIIAATNRYLEEAMEQGEFREDLFYRLNVFPIEVPPLRERKEDIPALVKHLIEKHGRPGDAIDSDALDVLLAYHWPGNVRELENVIERSLIMKSSPKIAVEDLPTNLCRPLPVELGALDFEIPEEGLSLESLEKSVILKTLQQTGGNKSKAAAMLGITRRKLYSRMEILGISE